MNHGVVRTAQGSLYVKQLQTFTVTGPTQCHIQQWHPTLPGSQMSPSNIIHGKINYKISQTPPIERKIIIYDYDKANTVATKKKQD